MGLKHLPPDYIAWLPARHAHLAENLKAGVYTADLFKQYRAHLGAMRFKVLVEGQKLIVPEQVSRLLRFGKRALLRPVMPVYRLSRLLKMDWMLRALLIPADYKAQISELDVQPD